MYDMKALYEAYTVEEAVKLKYTLVTFKVMEAAVAEENQRIAAFFKICEDLFSAVIESSFAVINSSCHVLAQHNTGFFAYHRVKLGVELSPHISGIESQPVAYFLVGVLPVSDVAVIREPLHSAAECRSIGQH